MQKSLFFMEDLRCTAGEQYKTHVGTLAIDYGGLNADKDYVMAPFDLIVKKMDTQANTVFFESITLVETPAFIDFICGRFAHCDILPSITKVGAIIKQGTLFYKEGTKAQGKIGVVGAHVHAVFGRGKLKGNYWYNVGNGNYALDCTGGSIHAWDAFFISQSVKIIKTNNYTDDYPWVMENEKKEEETLKLVTAKGPLYVRDKPGGKVLLTIPKGVVADCHLIEGLQPDGYQWAHVAYNGVSGVSQIDTAYLYLVQN